MLLLSAASSFVALAQTNSTLPAADAFRNEALVIERSETTIRMHADGTGERDVHTGMRVQSQGAAQQFGVLSFGYASANETPTKSCGYTSRRLDSRTPRRTRSRCPRPSPGSAALQRLKEKHCPCGPSPPGDTLEYDFDTTIDKADAPNQFWGVYHFTAPGTVMCWRKCSRLRCRRQIWSGMEPPPHARGDRA